MAGFTATAQTDVAATPERVWAALTEPEQIAAYMQGSQVTTTWEVGSPIIWDGEYDGRATRTRARCSPTTSRTSSPSPTTAR